MFSLIGIRGLSMAPTLQDGDIVIALNSRFRLSGPVTGDVVIVDHPHLGFIVKRVSGVNVQTGAVSLAGDGGLSTDSESIGYVTADRVLGRAIIRIPRTGYLRWLGRTIPETWVRNPPQSLDLTDQEEKGIIPAK